MTALMPALSGKSTNSPYRWPKASSLPEVNRVPAKGGALVRRCGSQPDKPLQDARHRNGRAGGVPRAFGMLVGHSPSAILSLPAFVSRSPPDNSCMYPSLIRPCTHKTVGDTRRRLRPLYPYSDQVRAATQYVAMGQ